MQVYRTDGRLDILTFRHTSGLLTTQGAADTLSCLENATAQ